MCAISNPPLCTSHLLALFCAFQFVGFANADSLLVCVCALPSPVVRHRRGANQWAQASVWAQRVSATQCCHSGVGFFYCRKPTAHFPIHRRHMCQVRRPVRKSHRQRVLAEFGGSRVTLAKSPLPNSEVPESHWHRVFAPLSFSLSRFSFSSLRSS